MRHLFLMLAGALCLAAVVPVARAYAANPVVADAAKPTKEFVATVESVDLAQKSIKVQEMEIPILITDKTTFDDEVQIEKLKKGAKVKLVCTTASDGKMEALEVRTAEK